MSQIHRRKETMKVLKLLLAGAVLSAVPVTFSTAKPDFAKKESKKCVDCHEGGNPKKLNAMGQHYKDHNHSLEGYKAEGK
jgi:hypothetical protein